VGQPDDQYLLKVRQDEEEEVWMLLSLLTGTKFTYCCYRAVYTDTTKMSTNTVAENKEE
jgi:hypothetical protein